MNYAIIKNSVVENVIIWDGVSAWEPPENTIVVQSDNAKIGWIWNGSDIVPPPEASEG